MTRRAPAHPRHPQQPCRPRSSAPAQLRSGPADHAARHPPHRCHPQAREGHPASRGIPGKSARLAGVHLHTGRATIEGTGNRRMTDAAPPRHTGTAARTCVLTELRDFAAAQRARPVLPKVRLLTGMSCSAGMGTAESGHLVPNPSPTSSLVLLVGISHTGPQHSNIHRDLRRRPEPSSSH
jgi:hypothetical protein